MIRHSLPYAATFLMLGIGYAASAEPAAEQTDRCVSTAEADAKLAKRARYDKNMLSVKPPLFDGEVRCRIEKIAYSYQNVVYPAVYEWTEVEGTPWLIVYRKASHGEEWYLLPDPIKPEAFAGDSDIDLFGAQGKCLRAGKGAAETRRCFLYWGAESPITTMFDWYGDEPLFVKTEIYSDIDGSERPAKISVGDETFDLDWIHHPGMEPIAELEGDAALRLTEAAMEAGEVTARITHDKVDDEVMDIDLDQTGEAYHLMNTLMGALKAL